MVVVSEFLIYC
jgi:hypothetical protein